MRTDETQRFPKAGYCCCRPSGSTESDRAVHCRAKRTRKPSKLQGQSMAAPEEICSAQCLRRAQISSCPSRGLQGSESSRGNNRFAHAACGTDEAKHCASVELLQHRTRQRCVTHLRQWTHDDRHILRSVLGANHSPPPRCVRAHKPFAAPDVAGVFPRVRLYTR